MEEERKKFYKKINFLLYFFSIIKNVFHYMFAKFLLLNPDACNLQPAVLNFAAQGHE